MERSLDFLCKQACIPKISPFIDFRLIFRSIYHECYKYNSEDVYVARKGTSEEERSTYCFIKIFQDYMRVVNI